MKAEHSRQCLSTGSDLAEKFNDAKGGKVLIVGDVMVDHYINGEVERISPEAPVPVVAVASEQRTLGGAGNVARNIKSLGGEPVLIGVRGDDAEGEMLRDLLREEGVDFHDVIDDRRPTTKKTRVMAQRQQIVRVDWETPTPVSGAALESALDSIRAHVADAKVVLLSDYGKGLVTSDFMMALRRILSDMDEPPKVYVDPKTRNFDLYEGVDLLTPNTKEAGEGSGVSARSKDGVLRAGLAIFKKLRCNHLLITLGPQGMAFFESPENVYHIPTAAKSVFDVTGAGDTVIATLALCAAGGVEPLEACIIANHAAGVVVGEVGAAAVDADRLARELCENPCPAVAAWMRRGEISFQAADDVER